jgi:hypothetical protein
MSKVSLYGKDLQNITWRVPNAATTRAHAASPYRVLGLGFRGLCLGFGVWGLGCRVQGLGFGVWGLGYGVWGVGLRV